MNASRIAIIFALLNLAAAVGLRNVEFKIEKETGFLGIFKYSNYNVYLKEIGDESGKLSKPHSKYDWYVWGGYQDKFAKGDYKVAANVKANDGAFEKTILTFAATDKPTTLAADNFPFPAACKIAKEMQLKVEEKGWEKNIKQINFSFMCTGVAEGAATQAVAEVITGKLGAEGLTNLVAEGLQAKVEEKMEIDQPKTEEPIVKADEPVLDQPVVEDPNQPKQQVIVDKPADVVVDGQEVIKTQEDQRVLL